MNEFAKAFLELSKECTTECITASKCITPKPCWVFKAIGQPFTSGAESPFYLRNGETVNSEILFPCWVYYDSTGLTDILPIYFNKGLFIELSGSLHRVTIQYLIE